MAQNRYLPFGYKVENGAVLVNETEAQVIRTIYHSYGEGNSYKSIAATLTQGEVRYMPDKPAWNKNMVARLLQNEKYLGTEKYPAILTQQEWQTAQLAQKPYTHTVSAELKAIKPYLVCSCCGKPLMRRLKKNGESRWYCEENPNHISIQVTDELLVENVQRCLDSLIRNPQKAAVKAEKSNTTSLAQVRLENEIDLLLEKGEISDAEIKDKIFALAAERYALCDDTTATTNWLVCTLEQAQPDTWLETGLLKQATEQIKVDANGTVTLILKNGQHIRKED